MLTSFWFWAAAAVALVALAILFAWLRVAGQRREQRRQDRRERNIEHRINWDRDFRQDQPPAS